MSRHLRDVLWPVLLVLGSFLLLGVLTHAQWPHDNRLDFAIIVWIAIFDLLMATVLLRRMDAWDWLAFWLGMVFLTKSAIWFTAAGSQLWPDFYLDHIEVIRWILRISLLISLPSAFAMLVLVPDERYAREQRAEGVIEGHAEGVAQEQYDQHEREIAAGYD
jgi:hypothetical protein